MKHKPVENVINDPQLSPTLEAAIDVLEAVMEAEGLSGISKLAVLRDGEVRSLVITAERKEQK